MRANLLLTAGLILIAAAGMLVFAPLAEKMQGQSTAIEKAQPYKVLSGQVTAIRANNITIIRRGEEIRVRIDTLASPAAQALVADIEKGMFITVEGFMPQRGEIIASRMTKGHYYDTMPVTEENDAINYGPSQ